MTIGYLLLGFCLMVAALCLWALLQISSGRSQERREEI